MSAVLRVESLRQNADFLQLIQTEKKSGSACRGVAPDRIGRIHAVDQEVRHTRTDAIDRHLPGLSAGKQRRTTVRVRSDPRLQRNRAKKVAVVERKFREALLWNESLDSRRCAINGGDVRADVSSLRKVAYCELRIDHHFGRRCELNPIASLRLESWFFDAKRIVSVWYAGETIFASHARKNASLQASALAHNRNTDAGD